MPKYKIKGYTVMVIALMLLHVLGCRLAALPLSGSLLRFFLVYILFFFDVNTRVHFIVWRGPAKLGELRVRTGSKEIKDRTLIKVCKGGTPLATPTRKHPHSKSIAATASSIDS